MPIRRISKLFKVISCCSTVKRMALARFSAENNTVDETTCQPYNPYNAITNPTGLPTTQCQDSSGNTVHLMNNPYYNQQTQVTQSAARGTTISFHCPRNRSRGQPVLIKVLNVFDECQFQSNYNAISVYGPSGLPADGTANATAAMSTEKFISATARTLAWKFR